MTEVGISHRIPRAWEQQETNEKNSRNGKKSGRRNVSTKGNVPNKA